MSLIFTQSLNHALVAYVIQIANKSGKNLGRTAVQKILYFLRARGIKTSYKFDIYHYGPYCQQILWDLELLLADAVIEDKSINPDSYSTYVPGDSVEELLQLHRQTLDAVKPVVEEVVNALAGLKPAEMELIATLDYIYREQRATGITENLKKKVVDRFESIKKDKFSSEKVSEAYDAMVSAHLVTA